jgi:hypothetical protein
MSSTIFLVGLTALVACKLATRISVGEGRFDHLPRPSQID